MNQTIHQFLTHPLFSQRIYLPLLKEYKEVNQDEQGYWFNHHGIKYYLNDPIKPNSNGTIGVTLKATKRFNTVRKIKGLPSFISLHVLDRKDRTITTHDVLRHEAFCQQEYTDYHTAWDHAQKTNKQRCKA